MEPEKWWVERERERERERKQIRKFCCKSSSSSFSFLRVLTKPFRIITHGILKCVVRSSGWPGRPRPAGPDLKSPRNEKETRSFKTAHVMFRFVRPFFFLALFYFILVSRWRSSQPEWGRGGRGHKKEGGKRGKERGGDIQTHHDITATII